MAISHEDRLLMGGPSAEKGVDSRCDGAVMQTYTPHTTLCDQIGTRYSNTPASQLSFPQKLHHRAPCVAMHSRQASIGQDVFGLPRPETYVL